MAEVLYVSYTGLLEPLGQSQVLAYLERLARYHRITLITFEQDLPSARQQAMKDVKTRVEGAGIRWHIQPYHQRPPLLARLWDVVKGRRMVRSCLRDHAVDIIHVRSFLPALMVAWPSFPGRAKLLFDIRGFWIDERVDMGKLRAGGIFYRLLKKMESVVYHQSSAVVSLTHAGKAVIERSFPALCGRVYVIPTCTDLGRFTGSLQKPDTGEVCLGYLGSTKSWYLFDECLNFFRQLLEQRPDALLLVVNRGDHGYIRDRLHAMGVPPESVEICAATPDEVPALLGRMSALVSFVRPSEAKRASAPTRLGEALAAGVPVITNAGVGDVAELFEGAGVGPCLQSFSRVEVDHAVAEVLRLIADPEISRRCRRLAETNFSLERGVKAYDAIYQSLTN